MTDPDINYLLTGAADDLAERLDDMRTTRDAMLESAARWTQQIIRAERALDILRGGPLPPEHLDPLPGDPARVVLDRYHDSIDERRRATAQVAADLFDVTPTTPPVLDDDDPNLIPCIYGCGRLCKPGPGRSAHERHCRLNPELQARTATRLDEPPRPKPARPVVIIDDDEPTALELAAIEADEHDTEPVENFIEAAAAVTSMTPAEFTAALRSPRPITATRSRDLTDTTYPDLVRQVTAGGTLPDGNVLRCSTCGYECGSARKLEDHTSTEHKRRPHRTERWPVAPKVTA